VKRAIDQSWRVVLALVVSGCSGQVMGLLAVPAKVDFGTVPCTLTVTATLTNQALSPLTITNARKQSGVSVSAAPFFSEAAPVFSLTLPQTIGPGAAADVDVTFHATTAGTHTAVLIVEAGQQQEAVELEATFVRPDEAEPPLPIDFGAVARGQRRSRPLPTPGAAELVDSNGVFSIDQGTVGFRPDSVGRFHATATQQVAPARGCAPSPLTVRVIGDGVESVTRAAPDTLDFGFVPASRTATRSLSLISGSIDPLAVTAEVIEAGGVRRFSLGADGGVLLPGATRDRTSLELLPGTTTLSLSFTPESTGAKQATLRIVAGAETLMVPLRGNGGAGAVSVSTPSLDFGTLTMAATRQLRVSNVGTRPVPPDPKGHLFLGVDGGMPYFELRHVSGAMGTVSVRLSSPYNPALGVAALSDVTFEVTALPGTSANDLHLFSTDFDRPDLVVPIIVK